MIPFGWAGELSKLSPARYHIGAAAEGRYTRRRFKHMGGRERENAEARRTYDAIGARHGQAALPRYGHRPALRSKADRDASARPIAGRWTWL